MEDVKSFLDSKYQQYGGRIFIEHDPVQIPHRFVKKQDIEIAGLLTAIIAWGLRKTIINNATKLLHWMDDAPYDFMLNSREKDLEVFSGFVHRTFNGDDCLFFINRLRAIYRTYPDLEAFFLTDKNPDDDIKVLLHRFKQNFFDAPHLSRTEKHIADPEKNASAKRLNMFLRWMVRNDPESIDFGIWKNIYPGKLMCPLDVHTGNVSRKLGLLQRKQSDWKAVEELTGNLRKFDAQDPVKYDISLFALGVFERF